MKDSPRLLTLLSAETHWTALAMKTQGSRFYRALGEALDAADQHNRRRIYTCWTDEIWDFYLRGQALEASEDPAGGT